MILDFLETSGYRERPRLTKNHRSEEIIWTYNKCSVVPRENNSKTDVSQETREEETPELETWERRGSPNGGRRREKGAAILTGEQHVQRSLWREGKALQRMCRKASVAGMDERVGQKTGGWAKARCLSDLISITNLYICGYSTWSKHRGSSAGAASADGDTDGSSGETQAGFRWPRVREANRDKLWAAEAARDHLGLCEMFIFFLFKVCVCRPMLKALFICCNIALVAALVSWLWVRGILDPWPEAKPTHLPWIAKSQSLDRQRVPKCS